MFFTVEFQLKYYCSPSLESSGHILHNKTKRAGNDVKSWVFALQLA